MDMTLRPGDFPVGSLESRAAMRFQIANQRDAPPAMEIVTVSTVPQPWLGDGPEPEGWNKVPRVERSPEVQELYVPPGMTIEEARKATGAAVCSMQLIVRLIGRCAKPTESGASCE
jgi:hypothetical protein